MEVLIVHLGRQPIYNAQFGVCGYELSYQGAGGIPAQKMDQDSAAQELLTCLTSVFPGDQLTDGKPVFIQFSRKMIIEDYPFLFQPGDIVVEISGKTPVDPVLERKLFTLRKAGYKLSLNSYSTCQRNKELLNLLYIFDIFRFDMNMRFNSVMVKELNNRLHSDSGQFMGSNIDAEDQLRQVLSQNFQLFQGAYFEARSTISRAMNVPASSFGRLFTELMSDTPDVDRCSSVVCSDVVLQHILLSRERGLYAEGKREDLPLQVKAAINHMGLQTFRHWLTLLYLKRHNVTENGEMPRQAFIRGRFIETDIRDSEDIEASPAMGFFLGAFSSLPKVTGQTLSNSTAELPLPQELKAALNGADNVYAELLDEAREWEIQKSGPSLSLAAVKRGTKAFKHTILRKELTREATALYKDLETVRVGNITTPPPLY